MGSLLGPLGSQSARGTLTQTTLGPYWVPKVAPRAPKASEMSPLGPQSDPPGTQKTCFYLSKTIVFEYLISFSQFLPFWPPFRPPCRSHSGPFWDKIATACFDKIIVFCVFYWLWLFPCFSQFSIDVWPHVRSQGSPQGPSGTKKACFYLSKT